MAYCINKNNPLYKLAVENLTKMLGNSNAAIAALELNQGFPLDKAPNGNNSILFNTYLEDAKAKFPTLSEYELIKKATLLKLQVYSDSFREWFGDWTNDPEHTSKVVDENGEPLIVYHDGASNINVFKPNTYGDIYFGDTLTAATYGGTETSVFLNIRSPFIVNGDNLEIGDVTEKLYGVRRISNLNGEDGVIYKNVKDVGEGIYDFEEREVKSFWSEYEKQGYGTVYSVKNPNLIKSATNNNGNFSISDNNIYHEHLFITPDFTKDTDLISLSYNLNLTSDNLLNFVATKTGKYAPIIAILENLKLPIVNVKFIDPNLIFGGYDSYEMSKFKANQSDSQFKRAYYDAASDTIYINIDATFKDGDASSIVMHELMHAYTVKKLAANPKYRQKFEQIIKEYSEHYYTESRMYLDSAYKHLPNNVEEFIADIWSDPELILNLKSIPSKSGNITLWEKIKKFFTGLFVGQFTDIKDNSLFAEASGVLNALLEETVEENVYKLFYEHENINFTTSTQSGYATRTKENADWSDITLALAVDFDTAGEKLTKKVAGNKYCKVLLTDKKSSHTLLDQTEEEFDLILDKLQSVGHPIKLNIAGNGLYSFTNHTQEDINDYVENVLKYILYNGIEIAAIRSGGQTGVDEAGIVAAKRLNIPAEVHTTRDYTFRVPNKIYKEKYADKHLNAKQNANGTWDISDEYYFKERFNVQNTIKPITQEHIQEISNQINKDLEEKEKIEQLFIKSNGIIEDVYDLDRDTRDILSLIAYLYSKEGMSLKDIFYHQMKYLLNDSYEVKIARKFVDYVQLRQAQLHQFKHDFGIERYDSLGNFDWENYLHGIDLRHEISEKDDLSKFGIIEDYKIDPAEIIVPKLYKTQFKLGNYDIADIDVNFFKKVNPFYNCSLKTNSESDPKVDVLIRTHTSNFNIIIKSDLLAPVSNLKRIEPKIENGWRLDSSGNKLYQIPEDLKYVIYADNKGVETLVVLNSETAEKSVRNLISSTKNLVSAQLFAENIKPTKEWINATIGWNNIKTNNISLLKLLKQLDTLSDQEIRQQLLDIYNHLAKYYKNDLANTLYNSFVRTLYMISVRIPTQSFLSIMAVKVAGLTNDDANNIFVTRWQFWLLGSDLDIDKSYLMGVDISSIGTYNHWSPLADYTTSELADISDLLPVPNGYELTTPNNYYKVKENPMLIELDSNPNNIFNLIISEYLELNDDDKVNKLQTIVKLLKQINKEQRFAINPIYLSDPKINNLIHLINKHNTHEVTAEEARNIILRNIVQASLDERNLKASYSPIDVVMDRFKDELKKIEDTDALERNLDDGGLSIARQLYNNSVGKKDVGIMANGLKAFFALTHYLNKHKADKNFINGNLYFLTRLQLKSNDSRYFSTISDIKFEEEALKILQNAFHVFCPELVTDSLTFTSDDASLLISSLTSLATDNAKELALAKMNASIDLACMHLFLVVMGYDPKDVIQFTTSPAFKKVVEALNSSVFIDQNYNIRDVISILKDNNANLFDDLTLIEFIYNCAQEMSKIAKMASINLGTKVDQFEAEKFFTSLEKSLYDLINIILGLNPNAIALGNYTIKSNIPELISITHNLLNPSEQLVAFYLNKLDSINQRNLKYHYIDESFIIDMNRFYRDNDYKQFIIDFYDLVKHNFNIFDCISNLPHFNKMLEAFVLANDTIKKHSSRARAELIGSKQYSKNIIWNFIEEPIDYGNGETGTRNVKVFDKINYGLSIQRKAGQFYDHAILSEWISEFGNNFTISYETEDGNTELIELKDNNGVAKFANFIAYDLIPILKDKFPKNKFLCYIRPDFRKLRLNSKELFLPKYIFNFDVDKLVSISDLNKAFYINLGFEELSNIKLKDLGLDIKLGKDLTLGELLYLYDRLCSISSVSQNSLSRAFETYEAKNAESHKDTIARLLSKIILEHDTGIRQDIIFNPILFTAFCYANQIRAKQKGIMRYNYDKESKQYYTLDISNMYIFNLDTVNKYKDALNNLDLFLQLYKSGKIDISLENMSWTILAIDDPNIIYSFPSYSNEISIENFFEDLIENSKDELSTFKLLITDLVKLNESIPKPHFKNYLTVDVFKKILKRLANLNVKVELFKNENGPNGYVENGIIYLNTASDITTTPMHELMHIVLGVMKYDSFDNYERLMNLVYTTDIAKQIYNEISTSNTYANLMDLDKKEEVFCRILEQICSNKITAEDALKNEYGDIYYSISELVLPYISKTFDIKQPDSLLLFLKDTISAFPLYNSTIFMKRTADSTGYLDEKIKAVKSALITNYIQDLVKRKILTQTEC